jgi:adenylylsulfate kinase
VTPVQREALLKQRGVVIWFTGLSGSGKSTVAHALERDLVRQGHLAFVLDGDNVRRRLNADLGFSDHDRTENIRRIGEVASLFADSGVICISAFISPFREDRQRARSVAGDGRFFEIYLSTSIEECERRDPKGLYQKARAGEIGEFTGITSPYEAPENPELEIDTTAHSVDDSVGIILTALLQSGHLQPAKDHHAGMGI